MGCLLYHRGIKTEPGMAFALADAAKAHEILESRERTGGFAAEALKLFFCITIQCKYISDRTLYAR